MSTNTKEQRSCEKLADALALHRQRLESELSETRANVDKAPAAQSATVEEWERELSAAMPLDFKDWWQNDRHEWPAVAAAVIRSQRADCELGWKMAAEAAPEAPTLTHELQQQCSDWGVYWRASDAHGVDLSIEQAEELLRRALGVEVAISKAAPQAQAAGQELPPLPEPDGTVEIDCGPAPAAQPEPEQAQQSERERFEDVARSLGFQRDELNRSNLSLVRKDYRNHATEECWKFWQAARADILARLEAVPSPLPEHPEPGAWCWSHLERVAISDYRAAMLAAAKGDTK